MLIWDETKRIQHIARHGIDFADLADVFERPHRTEIDDGQQPELRYRTTFLHGGRAAVLVWTERGANVRAISCMYARRRHTQRLIE